MRRSITGFSLAVVFAACTSSGEGPGGTGGAAGNAGSSTGGVSGQAGGSGGSAGGGNANAGGTTGGNAGASIGGSAGTSAPGGGGSPAVGGGSAGGTPGAAGAGPGGSTPAPANLLVTSAQGSYWKIGSFTEATSGAANVTIDDAVTGQTWEGFGGTFNESGWSLLTSKELKDQAIQLLFSASDGANLAWGLIPIGATDYALSRYTLDDTGTDVTPLADGSNRPAADSALSKFSLDRDGQLLIPYIKAAQAVKRGLRFWASPWTPPVWMKLGYQKYAGGVASTPAPSPSFYDGGEMVAAAGTLDAYAQYFAKFVQGYRAQGINIELVAPQNEPTYEQNYPSCRWDSATYRSFIGNFLGPVMKELNVSVMAGILSSTHNGDIDLAKAALADAKAASFLTVAGAQWDVLDSVNTGTKLGDLRIWATAHKVGNPPFCTEVRPPYCPSAYNAIQAPNDHAYGVESWGYLRDAITKGRVTAYSVYHMVLDKLGKGLDVTRDWKQNALLVVDGGKVIATPAYYVFRHLSQYVTPGAVVVGATGGDAVAFKNPDGSLVAVVYNNASANDNFTVAMGGKTLRFAMPARGWATVKLTP